MCTPRCRQHRSLTCAKSTEYLISKRNAAEDVEIPAGVTAIDIVDGVVLLEPLVVEPPQSGFVVLIVLAGAELANVPARSVRVYLTP